MRVMFGKEKDEPALSVPLASQEFGIWGGLAAGFIIAVLAYAGYRKYQERIRTSNQFSGMVI